MKRNLRFAGLVLAGLVGCSSDPGKVGPDLSPANADFGRRDLAHGSNDLAGTAADMAGADLAAVDFAGIDLAGQHIKNVFIIVMENNDWSTIKGSASALYINSLLNKGAYAEMYKNPPGIHPSEPNYLWLEAGNNFGVADDKDPSVNHQSSTQHLVTQLDAAGISWKSYQEDIDGATCPLTAVKEYVPKHNPAVFFDDVSNTNDPMAAKCIAHVRPYTDLKTDLMSGAVARYNFITPNLCHDMHGSDVTKLDFACVGFGMFGVDLVKTGDDWLKANVPMITGSSAFTSGGVLFIVWDEGAGSTSDGPIGMIVLSPFAKTNYFNSVNYTHSSMLRSVQEIFGVGPLLGDAPNATDLSDLFTTFP